MTTTNDHDILIRLEEKFDSLIATVNSVREQTEKTNGRVSALERWRSYLIGIGIGSAAIFNWLFK